MESAGALFAMRRALAAAGISSQLLQQPIHSNSSTNDRPSAGLSHPGALLVCCESSRKQDSLPSSLSQSSPSSSSFSSSSSSPFFSGSKAFSTADVFHHHAGSATPNPGGSTSSAIPGGNVSSSPGAPGGGDGAVADTSSPSPPLLPSSFPKGFSLFAQQRNSISLKFANLRMRCGLLSVPSSSSAASCISQQQQQQQEQQPHTPWTTKAQQTSKIGSPDSTTSTSAAAATPKPAEAGRRPRVVVVGSGWGAVSFLNSLDLRKYDVRVISPRNYFTFTPLLPAVAVGTLPMNACVAGVRQLLLRGGKPLASFTEAKVVDIDPRSKTIVCCSPLSLPTMPPSQQQHDRSREDFGAAATAAGPPASGTSRSLFFSSSPLTGRSETGFLSSGKMLAENKALPLESKDAQAARTGQKSRKCTIYTSLAGVARNTDDDVDDVALSSPSVWTERYDYLVLAAGAEVNTFNIPGVAEHAYFLKDYEDALAIRGRLLNLLETAALPHMTEKQQQQLLHFVIVGGGPTGVEIAGEISDFLSAEGKKYFPSLARFFKISLIEMLPALLPMYSQPVQQYALEHLQKNSHIHVELQTQVSAVERDAVRIRRSKKNRARRDSVQQQPLPPPVAVASPATRTGVDPTLPSSSSSSSAATTTTPTTPTTTPTTNSTSTRTSPTNTRHGIDSSTSQDGKKEKGKDPPARAAAAAAAEVKATEEGCLILTRDQEEGKKQNETTGKGKKQEKEKEEKEEGEEEEEIPCGMVIWATGIKSPPVCLGLKEKAAAKQGERGPPVLQVDQQLRVKGAQDVFALGDCSRVSPPQLSSFAASLWSLAVAHAHADGYHLPTAGWLEQQASRLSTYFPQLGPPLSGGFDFARYKEKRQDCCDQGLTREEFTQLLQEIDRAYRPPPPTAQNAKQQGQYLGLVFNLFADREEKKIHAPAFLPVNNGALAYLGDGAAVADFPTEPGAIPKPWLGGLHTLLLWRCAYMSMQPTWSGIAACISGWTQAALEGRPLGRERLASLHERAAFPAPDPAVMKEKVKANPPPPPAAAAAFKPNTQPAAVGAAVSTLGGRSAATLLPPAAVPAPGDIVPTGARAAGAAASEDVAATNTAAATLAERRVAASGAAASPFGTTNSAR